MTNWVFLRGLARERRHWGVFPDTFRAALPGARVLALDLPGNGALHASTSPTRIGDMAAFCRAELSRMGVAPPYQLLAMSLGAMVAVAWAAAHPDEVRAGVLINTSMRPFSPFHWRLRPANYPALLKLALLGGSARAWEETILRLTSRRLASSAAVLDDWIAYRRECPVSRCNALRQLLAAARFHAPARRPAPRVLVLASARDVLVDVRCSQRLAQAWQADIVVHPDAGHDLPLDDGAWVARQVRDWF